MEYQEPPPSSDGHSGGEPGLREEGAPRLGREPAPEIPLCGDFTRGTCTRPNCGYIHNINPAAGRGAQICGNFRASGFCGRSECRYFHNTNLNIENYDGKKPLKRMNLDGYEPELRFPPRERDFPKRSREDGNGQFKWCGDFAQNRCSRDKCSYVHNVNPKADRYSQICGDFRRGACTREECRYIHNENKMAIINRSSSSSSSAAAGYPPYGGAAGLPYPYAMLQQMQQGMGMNMRGDGRGYGGGGGLGMPMGGGSPAPYEQHKRSRHNDREPPTLCGDFSRGSCARDNCRFVHNLNPNAKRGSSLCGDFRLGRCSRDACRYVHADPSASS